LVLTFGEVEHTWVAVGFLHFSVRPAHWLILSGTLGDALSFALSSVSKPDRLILAFGVLKHTHIAVCFPIRSADRKILSGTHGAALAFSFMPKCNRLILAVCVV